ncbi:hypothetical protein ACO34A_15415 [Rhizobium sp. ACO-34A]|nr:HepT-like ribonuclease domain-containing protein [Rhizobium sp. ACO-34A]ATN35193.1 hypothetical protein ACO34A_15415 [Rhizobium sp. ACO-34A]
MTPEQRFLENLRDMQQAASEAVGFVRNSTLEAFEQDILSQRAVAMTFVLIAAAAARILAGFPSAASEYPDIDWRKIKGWRDMVVHEHEPLDWRLVWDTVQTDLPALISQIDQLRYPHIQGE